MRLNLPVALVAPLAFALSSSGAAASGAPSLRFRARRARRLAATLASQMSVFRSLLHLDDTQGQRFDLAVDLLASGGHIVFRGACLNLCNGILHVQVPSSWRADRVNEATALRDLEIGEKQV